MQNTTMSINMVNDIFLTAKDSILEGYGRQYTEEEYYKEKNIILNKLFSKKEIEEYNDFLRGDEVENLESELITKIKECNETTN